MKQAEIDLRLNSFAPDAFSLQYTSLILTILAFILGAFASNAVKHTAPLPQSPTGISSRLVSFSAPVLEELSTFNYNDLFIANGSLDALGDSAAALLSILKSHDLRLKGELGVGESEPISGELLERSMRRAAMLQEYLEEGGIPQHAVTIYAVDTRVKHQASLTLFKDSQHNLAKGEGDE
ncbi:MAG: hypothetical protein J5J00_05870 [Deltaproteobacteria bacterium]|nr:hypothetical protein [Deltaproteobacteria bacterium]